MSGSNGDATKRDALIYLSGLSSGGLTIDVKDAASRIAFSLDRNAATEKARFSLEQSQDVAYGKNYSSKKITINRTDPDGESQPLVDVYVLDYQRILKQAYSGRSPIRQAFSILFLLIASLPRFSGFLFKKGKSFGEKTQLLFAGLIILTIGLYLVTLISTAVGTGVYALTESPLATDAPDRWTEPLGAALDRLQPAIVFLTGVGLLWRQDVKSFVADLGVEYASAIDYLAFDNQKGVIVGNFAALLESIVESDADYRKIHVLAYSFGSIVAIDALFQRREPPERFKRIDSLVTVGSPFDLVRSFWPNYYVGRLARPGEAATWLNIYSPDDVFSSNFRDDAEVKESDAGIEGEGEELFRPTRNVAFDWTARSKRRYWTERLRRIRQLHMIYWGGDASAQTYLDDVVRLIYRDDFALS